MEAHYFNVNLKWLNDRKVEISSPELATTIEVATPPPFAKRKVIHLVARAFTNGSFYKIEGNSGANNYCWCISQKVLFSKNKMDKNA